MVMRTAATAALGLAVIVGSAAAAKTPIPSIVSTTCSACHGKTGVSMVPTFPDLAGQGAPYLVKQIKDFKDHKRADPQAKSIMWGMAATIPAKQINAIADYFASQKPAAGATENPKLVAAGRKLYLGGDASDHLPACSACHGPTGLGLEPLFPRLAGQHQSYVVTQLTYFKKKERTNDPLAIMRTVAGKLSKKQMTELAAFIRTL